jgi:hypothetical protein
MENTAAHRRLAGDSILQRQGFQFRRDGPPVVRSRFAGHRDSVREFVGDGLENAIEEKLSNAGISFRKTRRAERIQGFDQAPDFTVPSEFNPKVF